MKNTDKTIGIIIALLFPAININVGLNNIGVHYDATTLDMSFVYAIFFYSAMTAIPAWIGALFYSGYFNNNKSTKKKKNNNEN